MRGKINETDEKTEKEGDQTKRDDQTKVAVEESETKKILTPGSIFGDLSIITQKKWRHCIIYALEESALLKFSNHQINRIVKVIYKKLLGIKFKSRISRIAEFLNINISRLFKCQQFSTAQDY